MEIYYHPAVDKFIKQLPKQSQAKVIRNIILLEKYGLDLGMPHVKKIRAPLFELRTRGQQEIRLLFIIKSNACCLVHGFIKKTSKTPSQEIKTALNRIP